MMKRIIPFFVPALSVLSLLCLPPVYAYQDNGNQRPIFIALVAPFSGPLAEYGRSMLRGARTRGNEGGDHSHPHARPVRLIALDDGGDPARAMQLAGHIASHPSIVAVVGHLTTTCTLAAIPCYHDARLTIISPAAAGNDLDTVESPYLFRTILSERQQATSLARHIHRTMGKVTVALVFEDSNPGIQLKKAFLFAAEAEGLSVKSFSMGRNPFAPLSDTLHTIALLRPEALFVAGGSRLAALILRKWPKGIDKPMIFGTYRLIFEEFRELVGDQERGIMAAHPSAWRPDFQRGAEIRARHEKRWKYRMDWLAAQAYDAADLLFWAIREAGSNLNALSDALRGLNSKKHALPGLAGPIYFNPNGSLAREVTVTEYTNGQWRLKKERAVGSKK
jgi:branched-chain amino acid transport system substrate-binding protein